MRNTTSTTKSGGYAVEIHSKRTSQRQTIAVGKRITCDSALAEWVEWMNQIGFAKRTFENHSLLVGAWLRESGLGSVSPANITEKHVDRWINDARSDTKMRSCLRPVVSSGSAWPRATASATLRRWCALT
jgi:hypothetical protein